MQVVLLGLPGTFCTTVLTASASMTDWVMLDILRDSEDMMAPYQPICHILSQPKHLDSQPQLNGGQDG